MLSDYELGPVCCAGADVHWTRMATWGDRSSADELTNVVATTTITQTHFGRQQLLTPDTIEKVDWHYYSAPQSRVGSFKKPRRTGLTDTTPRSSLPSLEDSITAKLLELQQLEADDCRVVREFVTSARGGIVHRGDSFRRNRETTTEMSKTTRTQTETDRQEQRAAASAAAVQPSEVGAKEIGLADTVACRVVIMGDRGVGKTALLQQLMTSHYMAAMNTCSFGESTTLDYSRYMQPATPNNRLRYVYRTHKERSTNK